MCDTRDRLILSLAEKLWICSRLLTCAAERLRWDDGRIQELLKGVPMDSRELQHERNDRRRFRPVDEDGWTPIPAWQELLFFCVVLGGVAGLVTLIVGWIL